LWDRVLTVFYPNYLKMEFLNGLKGGDIMGKIHRNKKQTKYKYCMSFRTVEAEKRINRKLQTLMKIA